MISIVIPIYNDEKYILDCLKSVAKQTFTDFECLCMDDGSTDNTVNLINDFIKEDNRFVLYQNNHKGPGWQRNFGIQSAKGEYITFMDHDDFVEVSWLAKLYDTLKTFNVDVAYCSNSDYYDDSKEEKEYYFPESLQGKLEFNHSNIPQDLVCCYFAPWRRLVRRDLLIDNKIFFAEGNFKFDDVFFTQLLMQNVSSAAFCNEILYHHRIFNSSITGNGFVNKDVFFEHFETAQKVIEYAKDNNMDSRKMLEDMFPLFVHYLFYVDSKMDFYKKLKQLVYDNHFSIKYKFKLLYYFVLISVKDKRVKIQ